MPPTTHQATQGLTGGLAGATTALALVAALAAGCATLPWEERERADPVTTAPAVARPGDPERRALERAIAGERTQRETLERERDALQRQRDALQRERTQLRGERDVLRNERAQLLATVGDRRRQAAAASRELEEKNAALSLQLIERDVQIKGLTERLDAAIREVVRVMAKLRSLESRAEAASHLAEAEIAVRRAATEAAGREPSRGLVEAQPLLAAAVREFQDRNYGGVLYLATQVKTLLKGGPEPVAAAAQPRTDGEVAFAVPLPLRTIVQSQVRQGPGSEYPALFVAEEGEPLTSRSVKGLWVRVTTEDGRSGWIHYTLVTRR